MSKHQGQTSNVGVHVLTIIDSKVIFDVDEVFSGRYRYYYYYLVKKLTLVQVLGS